MEYVYDYLVFGAKALTIAVLVVVPVLLVLLMVQARRGGVGAALDVRKLNDELEQAELTLAGAILPTRAYKQRARAAKQAHKRDQRKPAEARARTFVCDFDGDLRASAVEQLRREVTAILTVAGDADEVIVRLESGGGTIHGYGLAASQLERIRTRGIRLRVAVDRIAASGGYMMACVADEIVAAPFAIVGSIGVVAQLPNFNRLLRKHDIDFEQVTAGKYKRTLTLFGENSDAARDKFQQDIDEAHTLFKQFVAEHRPGVDIDAVGTGEYWFASVAQSLGLVDSLATSDDIIVAAAAERDVFAVTARARQSLLQKLGAPVGRLLAPTN